MKQWLRVAALLVAGLPLFAHAQQWLMFVPAERDFRVLLPATPARAEPREGSVEYRVTAGPYQFFVFRHDRRLLASPVVARADVFRRLTSDEQQVRSGVAGFPHFANLPRPETCHTRANAFSRRFCEYLSCQAPGHESHPACAGIPRFIR